MPTGNSTAGTGANNIVSTPALFTKEFPNLYRENYCSATNILLEGTTDTSGLASAVTDYSDGYFAKSTISLDTLFNGAVDSWRGACFVYYSSQYVQDTTNGSICHIYMRETKSGPGP